MNKPQIRFKGFSGPWKEDSLGSIAKIYQPQTISQSQLTISGYPVYGANGIIGFYSKYNHENTQIAITCRGNTCGTVNFTVPKSWITGNAMVVNLDDASIDKQFAFYYLQSKDMTSIISGSGQPQITRKPIAEFTIIFPDRNAEQKAIGEYFRNLDELIAEAEREVERLEKMKQASLQKMFPRPGESVPEIRFKGFSDPWKEDSLGSIAKIYQPQTISQSQLTISGYPVYGANGIIGFYSKYNHENTQIAITCRGNTCGTVNFTVPKSWITGNAMVVNLDDASIDKQFAFYYLQSKDMTSIISGSGQPQITRKPIAEFTIIFPDRNAEQKAIGEYFRNLDELIAGKRKRLEKLREIKQSCLDLMFV